ncbi:MAG TPA: tyrosine-type recombinase/integrase [Solirubrobacteraceae bacterium]|nr:tyrosine-type recombinase/integrase [Solirubrobacteraceae bacterium]
MGTYPHPPLRPSGHAYRVERKRGPVWYAKYRLPDGRQVQRKLGPAWTERGRPPAGYYTKRLAEDWLRDTLDQARRGELPGLVQTGATIADAAAEYLRYIERDRERKPSTVVGYRWLIDSQILPQLAETRLEDLTQAIVERWLHGLTGRPSSRRKALVILHGIMERARKTHRLPLNPVRDVEKPPQHRGNDIDVLAPDEVRELVRAAATEPDAALYLTAAFTGLRMGELIALRWRDIDYVASAVRVRASYTAGALTTPKSGKTRAVPLAPDVAEVLRRLRQRDLFTADDDLVFPGEVGTYLDGSALRRRYKTALARAGLRPLRFHDLRHTFGTTVIAHADIRRVQEWMGHADIQTTMRYLHYAPRAEDAQLVAEAFRPARARSPSASAR